MFCIQFRRLASRVQLVKNLGVAEALAEAVVVDVVADVVVGGVVVGAGVAVLVATFVRCQPFFSTILTDQ